MNLPRSVEFNQDVLCLVESNFIEVFGDEDFDGVLVPVLGNVFREQMRLDFAIDKVLNEGFHRVRGELLRGWLVLGHLFFQMDESHGWEFALLHAEEFEDTLMVIFISVDGDEQNLI